MSRFRKSFIVKYIHGFNLGLHNYYLSVQHTDTEALVNNHVLTTKISRLCLNDLSFTKSYTELSLKCASGSRGSISSLRSIDYNELVAAKLVQFTNGGEHYLLGLFQQTTRTNFNMTVDSNGIRQAVCVFPMRAVTAKIHENINRCYNSDAESQVMRGLNFIKPDQKCSYSSRRTTSADDYCASSADNGLYPIGGSLPLQANSILEFDTSVQQPDKHSIQFDSMQFVSKLSPDTNSPGTLALMSNSRAEIWLFRLHSSIYNEPELVRQVKLTTDDSNSQQLVKTPLTNMEVIDDQGSPSLLVVSKSTLFKIELDSCASFKSCEQCVAKSPHCGWCAGECTTAAQCALGPASWLTAASRLEAQSVCVDIVRVHPERKFKYDNEWVEVEFKRELSTIAPVNSSFECVFRHDVDGNDEAAALLRTDAVVMSSNKLKCALPHLSKIKFM